MKFKPFTIAALTPLLLAAPAVLAEEAAKPKETVRTVVLDFGDHSSSTLTTKAWEAFAAKEHAAAIAYAEKCIELYRKQALPMQKALTGAPADNDAIAKNWALNDVGTCYYILGQTLEAEGRKKQAIDAYQTLVKHLPMAHCWDEKGWYWKPADPARERIKALEFETLE